MRGFVMISEDMLTGDKESVGCCAIIPRAWERRILVSGTRRQRGNELTPILVSQIESSPIIGLAAHDTHGCGVVGERRAAINGGW